MIDVADRHVAAILLFNPHVETFEQAKTHMAPTFYNHYYYISLAKVDLMTDKQIY